MTLFFAENGHEYIKFNLENRERKMQALFSTELEHFIGNKLSLEKVHEILRKNLLIRTEKMEKQFNSKEITIFEN